MVPGIAISVLHEVPLERLTHLIAESESEGLSYLTRMQDEYLCGRVRFAAANEVFLVAESGGQIIGVCGLTEDTESASTGIGRVRKMYVHPAHRRQGVGTKLLRELVAIAERHYGELRVRANGSAGFCFYEAFGFTRVEEGRGHSHSLGLGGR